MLSDPDGSVRLAAAQRLAQDGNQAGLAALREASHAGGWSGAVATVLLARLGEEGIPASAACYSVQKTLLLRLAALSISPHGPAQLPELWHALSDPQPAVRRLVALRAAEIEGGVPLLLALRSDPVPAVRAQVQALLGSRRSSAAPLRESYPEAIAVRALGEARDPTAGPDRVRDRDADGEATALTERAEGGPSTPPEPAATPAPAKAGLLLLRVSPGTLLQLDDGPWGTAGPQPLVLAAGPHVLRTVESTQTIVITADAETSLTLTPARAEQAYAEALQAAHSRRYSQSWQRLDEAAALCQAVPRQSKPGCRTLLLAIAFQRAQLCAAQHMLPEAMRHYQVVLEPSARVAAVPSQREEARAASTRLSRLLGRVQLEHRGAEGCVVETYWMVPGQKSAVVDGVRHSFQVRAGMTLRIGSCS
jgi:hypothetical protein